MDLSRYERYRDLVGDWDAFAAYQERPLAPTVWTNTLRTTPEELREYLAADGIPSAPIPWLPGAFRLPVDAQPGKNLGRLLGLFHIQEEVSMMPIQVLDPRPGERVLDLCAAPGNKTVQAAVAMGNRGTVIANDVNRQRVGLIFQSIERLGVTNVAILDRDAGNLPRAMGLYDRVLADVPCSCEGTLRRHPHILLRPWRPGFRHSSQVAILRKAVQLCRPGGRVVYSTCTYAPEENEQVVDEVLKSPPSGSRLRLLPACIEGLETSPGITSWRDRRFDPSLADAMRIYPHQNDTGGFFIALIEKLADGGGPRREDPKDAPTVASEEAARLLDPEPFFAELERRFAIPRRALADDVVIRSSSKRASLVRRRLELPARPEPWALGMPFYSTKRKCPRLASAMARRLGRHAKRNVVDLDEAQKEDLVAHREVRLHPRQAARLDGEGYVLPRWRGYVVTVAVYRTNGDGGVVRGLIPKLWSQVVSDDGLEDGDGEGQG